jgi:hypothetical protein
MGAAFAGFDHADDLNKGRALATFSGRIGGG